MGIGTLREQHLHAALKEWYRKPGDRSEVGVEGFIIDLVRDSDLVAGPDVDSDREPGSASQLIEIQTRSFSSLRRKLDRLLDRYVVRLVHPIAAEKWIRRIDDSAAQISRRRSPKRGIAADVCPELASFPTLLSHPHFTLELLLIQEEEVRQPDSAAWRRHGWRTAERRLIAILERIELGAPADLLELLPSNLPDPFTTANLAAGLDRPLHLAQAVAYCLREAGVLHTAGRCRAGIQYRRPRA